MSILNKLNNALKGNKSQNVAATATLRHENEAAILDAITKLLSKSETGRMLLSYAQENGVEMHVLRSNTETHGFFPEKSTIYVSCPAAQDIPDVSAVIHMAEGLREAMLEATTMKRPAINLGKERFLAIHAERDKDIALHQTKVVYEIHQATNLTEIIDSYKQMGYGALIEAYKLDLTEMSLEN